MVNKIGLFKWLIKIDCANFEPRSGSCSVASYALFFHGWRRRPQRQVYDKAPARRNGAGMK